MNNTNNWIIKIYFNNNMTDVWYSVYYRDDYIDSFSNHDDAIAWVVAHNNSQVIHSGPNGRGY